MARSSVRILASSMSDPSFVSMIEREFPGMYIPSLPQVSRGIEKTTTNTRRRYPTTDHVPDPFLDYETVKEKLRRYGVTGVDLQSPPVAPNVPAKDTVRATVPNVRNVTSVDKLRSNDVVFYDTRSGEVQVVATKQNAEALRFWHSYFGALPHISYQDGASFRDMADGAWVLTFHGAPVLWGRRTALRAYIGAHPDGLATADAAVHEQPATFVEIKEGVPSNINLNRVLYLMTRTSNHKSL